jgi:hypothetical protein
VPQIVYVGPYDEVDVPLYRIRARRGEPVEVPVEAAGREAGDWYRLPQGEGAPSGWPTRAAVDEHGTPVLAVDDEGEPVGPQLVEARDPGEGLLAQECWVPAAPVSSRSRRTQQQVEGAEGAGQEG